MVSGFPIMNRVSKIAQVVTSIATELALIRIKMGCGHAMGNAFQKVCHVVMCALKVTLNVKEDASILRKAMCGNVMANVYQKIFRAITDALTMSTHFAEVAVLIGMKCGCAMANVF